MDIREALIVNQLIKERERMQRILEISRVDNHAIHNDTRKAIVESILSIDKTIASYANK